jgi:uncharacterized protein (TIGR02145 family)
MKYLFLINIAFLLLMGNCGITATDSLEGEIQGIVIQNDNEVPNARLALFKRNPEQSDSLQPDAWLLIDSTQSGSEGDFSFKNLSQGLYEVSALLSGESSGKSERINLEKGETQYIEIIMVQIIIENLNIHFGDENTTINNIWNINNQSIINLNNSTLEIQYAENTPQDFQLEIQDENGSTSQITLHLSFENGEPLWTLVGAEGQITATALSSAVSSSSESSSSTLPSSQSTSSFCTEDSCGTLTDARDGQEYSWVKIGSNKWMAENLNFESAGSRCLFDEPAKCQEYGRLYSWEGQNSLCPENWHTATRQNWIDLGNYIASQHGQPQGEWNWNIAEQLKARQGWTYEHQDNLGNGTDDYGFQALPGGFGYPFDEELENALWWTATASDSLDAYIMRLSFDSEKLDSYTKRKDFLLSVRCVENTSAPGLSSSEEPSSSSSSLPPSSSSMEPSSSSQPSSSSEIANSDTLNTPPPSAYCTDYPDQCGSFIDPRDDRRYAWVQYGEQKWMAENLKFTPSQSTGHKCKNDLESNCDFFGRMYRWALAADSAEPTDNAPSGIQGLCPAGWHLPSDPEWIALRNYFDDEFGYGSSQLGPVLKSDTLWANEAYGNQGNGSNEFGFYALPGGYLPDGENKTEVRWWTASQYPSTESITYFYLTHTSNFLNRYHEDPDYYQHVRCVEN